MPSQRLIFRHAIVSVSFVVLYFLLNRPEVIFISRIGFVAWYPAIGLVMALLLGLSPRYAFLVLFADALAGKIIYGQPITSFSSSFGAVASATSYGIVAYVLRGPLKIDLGLRRRRDVVRYVMMSAVGASFATIFGVASLIGDHAVTWSDYRSSAVGWFLGDAIGLVGIAPFLLVHVFPHVRRWLSPTASIAPSLSSKTHLSDPKFRLGAIAEAFGQSLTIFAVLLAMFGSGDGRYDHFYLSFIPIIWIAMRQGIRRVVTGLLVMNFGMVVAMHLFPPTVDVFTKVALLMLVLSSVGLIVGSEVSERHRMAIDLHKQTAYLDALIQNSPMGIVVLDRQGAVELANSAFEKLFQSDHAELASFDIVPMGISGEVVTGHKELIQQIFAGDILRKTFRHQLKSGQILDLALHGVPLTVSGSVRGAYLIYEDVSEEARASEAQRQQAEVLRRLVKELEFRTTQMTVLNEMGAMLASCGSVKEACSVVGNSVQKLFPESPYGALYLFRSSRDLLEVAIRWKQGDEWVPTFLPDACWALRRGQPYWSSSAGNDIPCPHLAGHSNSDTLCAPLVAQGKTLGVLQLEFGKDAQLGYESDTESFQEAHQRIVISAASQIALSLASLHLRETLREQSIRDPLTRLFNRRFLEESFERELQLAVRKKKSIAVLFIDIDHFKTFNDTFGHDAGDMVLRSLADLFRDYFRATDICCRYGGEEFAIILPESTSQAAAVRADGLRSEVKALRLRYKKEALGQLTISVGLAAFPEHGTSSEELLKIADRCLYESKARGRDTVTVPET
jgi:diguanylate cyclase (GGDEF)-like protein/PAS domain S-box-containing protein